MKNRKNKLVVEFTTSKPITERQAAQGLQMLIDERLDLFKAPIWNNDFNIYGEKVKVKSFTLVLGKLK